VFGADALDVATAEEHVDTRAEIGLDLAPAAPNQRTSSLCAPYPPCSQMRTARNSRAMCCAICASTVAVVC